MQVSFLEWDHGSPARQTVARLAPDQVQVWTATIPAQESQCSEFIGLLSTAERERAAGFKADAARRQFIFGRISLRQVLGACLEVAPAAVKFGYQPGGKPFLLPPATEPDVRFNLSHSGEMIAIALACGREVGVDLEWIHGLESWVELCGRVFSAREQAALRSLPAAQQRLAFFNGWTRKEAWLKATGEGLTDALPTIEATLAPGTKPAWLSLPGGPQTLQQWSLHSLPLPADYAGAVVVQERCSETQVRRELNS